MIKKGKAVSVLMVMVLMGISMVAYADDSYKESLELLQNKVPLTYNEAVRKAINSYSGQKSRFATMIGLSRYYFPIYEKVFKDQNVPDELKYISVIESSLNPQAVSRVGATGPWQFMYEIGKIYGLTVNDTVDERKDPLLACKAAASYLLDSYNMYGDWLLTVASYNCGRNNIKWAMEKAGGKKDYWAIRKYLPVETQHYVPAYIATVYLMNNYRRHGINPVTAYFNTNTEVVKVNTKISLLEMASLADLNSAELSNLNPAFKNYIVSGSKDSPKNIVIPVLPDSNYNALCRVLGLPERGIPAPAPVIASVPLKQYYYIMYNVQEGDTPNSIAKKFSGTAEDEFLRINKLESNSLTPGKVLQIKLEKA